MLPAVHRLTDGREFRTAIRAGRRAGSRTLVVHLAELPGPTGTSRSPRVGLVVSRAVGNAVTRTTAATAGSKELGADLGRCLHRVLEEVAPA